MSDTEPEALIETYRVVATRRSELWTTYGKDVQVLTPMRSVAFKEAYEFSEASPFKLVEVFGPDGSLIYRWSIVL